MAKISKPLSNRSKAEGAGAENGSKLRAPSLSIRSLTACGISPAVKSVSRIATSPLPLPGSGCTGLPSTLMPPTVPLNVVFQFQEYSASQVLSGRTPTRDVVNPIKSPVGNPPHAG